MCRTIDDKELLYLHDDYCFWDDFYGLSTESESDCIALIQSVELPGEYDENMD